MDRLFLKKKIKEFLDEDIGYKDITTDNLSEDKILKGKIVAKSKGIVAGIPFAEEVFKTVDESLKIKALKKDGDRIFKGDTILEIEGSGKSILKGERVALNILQRLSGISTNTNQYVEKIKDLNTKILDTRKTTPGFRAFEKYGVKIGGGDNHRFALYDMVLIKDNHILLAGSIKKAVEDIKSKVSPMVKIEVEVSNLEQLKEALEVGVDVIMLDNMYPEDMKRAVHIVAGKVPLEASGNVNLNNIREIALTGVDYISIGALIHSAKWLDMSLKVEEV